MTPEEIDAIARERLGAQDIDRIARERLAAMGQEGASSPGVPAPQVPQNLGLFGSAKVGGLVAADPYDFGMGVNRMRAAGQGLTYGGADEAEAALRAAPQAAYENIAGLFTGEQATPVADIYSKNLGDIRQSQAQYAAENPWESAMFQGAGAIASPINKLLAPAKGIGTIAEGVMSGAKAGGLAGFLSGEGGVGERAKQGARDALTGGVVSGALTTGAKAVGKAGEMLEVWGPAEQKKALGISVADANKAAKKVGRGAENPIDAAMKRLQSMDAPEDVGGKLLSGSKDPPLIHDKMLSKLDEVDSKLVSVLERAEKSLKPEDLKGITPNVLDAVKEKVEAQFSGLDQEVALKHLDEQLGAYARQAKKATKGWSSGVLPFLQKMKQGSWKSGYGTDANASTKAAVDRMIGFEIKGLIENVVDKLANTGKIDSGLAGQVKSLNKDMGAILQILPSVAKKANLSTGQGVLDPLYGGLFRTGGSLGAMVLGGAATGNVAPAVANAILQGITSFPTARYGFGSGLVGAGNLAKEAGGLISRNIPGLTSGLVK